MPTGYLMGRAMVDKTRLSGLAHRLVWRHFNGPIPVGLVINHRNGDKADNRLANLEVVTPSENARHATRILGVGRCTDQNGMMNHAAKLTTDQVWAIRARRAAGERLTSIAADYGIAMQTVSKLARGASRISG